MHKDQMHKIRILRVLNSWFGILFMTLMTTVTQEAYTYNSTSEKCYVFT